MQLGELVGDRLASVPVLSTILRVDLRISDQYWHRAIRVVQNWASRKRPSLQVDWAKQSGELHDGAGYECSFAETDEYFALSFHHPDSSVSERSWLVDSTVERRESSLRFATRLSIRQPKAFAFPSPRAPRILSELVKSMTIIDAFPLSAEPTKYDAEDLDGFLQLLRSPYRTLPLIAVSSEEVSGLTLVDAALLASMLAGVAHVAVLSPQASWELTRALGKTYSVYQGAVRCYAARFSVSDPPKGHRLWLAEGILRSSSDKDRFINQCLTYCFAQVTSTFESFPIVTPRALKTQMAIPMPVGDTEAPLASSSASDTIEPLPIPPLSAEVTAASVPSLESPVPTTRLDIDHIQLEMNTVVVDGSPLARELVQELVRQISDLELKLQELRSQNAELAKSAEEEQYFRAEFEKENQGLHERIAILSGSTLDQSQPGAMVLKGLSDAALAAQVLVDDYRHLRGIAATVDAMKVEMDKLREENFDLNYRIAVLEQRGDEGERQQQEIVVQLQDADSLQSFFAQKSDGHFEITNKARRSFKMYPYLDEKRLNSGMKLLRDIFIPMKLASDEAERSRLNKTFQEELTTLRFKYGKTATPIGRGMAPEDHTVKVDGRTFDLYKLRDITEGFNWQRFFCVYFAWDDQSSRLIINSFGHGDSPSSHT